MLLEDLKNIDDNGPQDYELYVDLDGVLADFEAGLANVLGEPYSAEKYKADPRYRTKMWQAIENYQKSAFGGELWFELPVLENGKLWDHVKVHNPEILSASGNPDHEAAKDKHKWVAKHLGSDVKVNLVRHSADKAKFAAKNRILIDDRQKSIGPWEAAGGIGILHTSAADTIRKLKELGL